MSELMALAEEMYRAYGRTTDFKNFRGDPMPTWEELPDPQKSAWLSAAERANQIAGNACNHSNTTADNEDNPNKDLIVRTKELRQMGDKLLQFLKELRDETSKRSRAAKDVPAAYFTALNEAARELSLSITHCEDSIMRLGMTCKRLGAPNPYPHSYDASNAKVEPTADGLKM